MSLKIKLNQILEAAKHIAALESKVEDLEESLAMMFAENVANAKELANLHNRLNMANGRTAHVEHYLGIRFHNFPDGERMWDFRQIMNDMSHSTKPKSRFAKKVANKRRDNKAA